MDEGLYAVYEHPMAPYSIHIEEEEGRVCYAYLVSLQPGKEPEIVSHVWLYNCAPTPETNEWDPCRLTPLNSREYAKDCPEFQYPKDISGFSVRWQESEIREVAANIFVREKLFAVLSTGENPGSCIMAKRDGPLAKALTRGS